MSFLIWHVGGSHPFHQPASPFLMASGRARLLWRSPPPTLQAAGGSRRATASATSFQKRLGQMPGYVPACRSGSWPSPAGGAGDFGSAGTDVNGSFRSQPSPFLAASTPLGLQGNIVLSTIVLGAAALAPAAWAIRRLPGGRSKDLVLGIAVVAGLGLWAGARLGGWSGYDEIESVRSAFSIWGTTLFIVDRAVLPRLAGEPIHMIRPSFIDVSAVALLTGGALASVNLFHVPSIAVAGLVVLAILARPVVRHRFRPIEDALLADVRTQAKARQRAEDDAGGFTRTP